MRLCLRFLPLNKYSNTIQANVNILCTLGTFGWGSSLR